MNHSCVLIYIYEMVGWHHRLDGHELEQALGAGDGQGNLACCSPWGGKESDVLFLIYNIMSSGDRYYQKCYELQQSRRRKLRVMGGGCYFR